MLKAHRPRHVRSAVALTLVLLGSVLAGPVDASPARHGLLSWLNAAAPLFSQFPALGSGLQFLVGPSSLDYGSDGRLTVLVVGSDYRSTRPGERLDAVMVATINPLTHQMAAVSIPRDTGELPLPDPNDTYKGKVNSLFRHYKDLGNNREVALDLMRATIAYALDIEIDNVAYARFTGFDFLVDQLGYVAVDTPETIRDASIVDDRTKPHGALFPAATDYQLGGANATQCYTNGPPVNWLTAPACHHALLYVRSRHGYVGTQHNSNYKRDKRQQSFLMSAVRRVVALTTANSSTLTTLRDAALTRTTDFYTDLPITQDADLLALYLLYNGAQNQPFLQATLKPRAYAKLIPGTSKYALKLDAVRTLTHAWFAPVP
ncbi:MAG: polyisoprenyl-teichoic acid--peptidoglycan teichoic acid transferase [Chloroflexota bacterium]|jgi:anionic cell wall polymer biosynthesis LytR-Cps2A-Psr (LCP) family protein|nr:polyisoprenyl-teichoic acid--peptidoglycan teichoic acid transferase [Chloroflexota bacterium]